ncbi:SDR family NAD(P)-dependent oxidoreductase [Kineosporia succinea]|uniref:NAD(P)-dependent dehydrogenase (Short-subunit alcohol dehydrogenase family) n=1 Tax=Kineosporia succinea TaxID=84632 RepID=A0ABT9P0J8_9ACTN|nr:SDR family NAD(P)-dependent oxidoreductase [Kineosporia succinea]MDP9826203.1 NAD(P)-dependent dehydrogenase (short-subunit alcohol dehydrogenase family) [Kineosporia succinea]
MKLARTIVITGASDGVGAAAARELSRQGHQLVLVGRSPEKTDRVADELGAERHVADFSDLGAVRDLAATLLDRHDRIDVLANNAGGVFGNDRVMTRDGHELTFQVNYLAPFLLTHLLLDRLVSSRATVVNTSSSGNRLGRVDLENLSGEKRFSGTAAYSNAKLMQILHARELDRRYGAAGLRAAGLNPGNIRSNFAQQPGSALAWVAQNRLIRRFLLKTPEQGADTLVFLAAGASEFPSGEYFVKRKVTRTNKQAYDAELCRRLWERSEQLVTPAAG